MTLKNFLGISLIFCGCMANDAMMEREPDSLVVEPFEPEPIVEEPEIEAPEPPEPEPEIEIAPEQKLEPEKKPKKSQVYKRQNQEIEEIDKEMDEIIYNLRKQKRRR